MRCWRPPTLRRSLRNWCAGRWCARASNRSPKKSIFTAIVAALSNREVDFAQYRMATIVRRLERRRLLVGEPNFAAYAQRVLNSPSEREALRSDMMITVTGFFRDRRAWRELARFGRSGNHFVSARMATRCGFGWPVAPLARRPIRSPFC